MKVRSRPTRWAGCGCGLAGCPSRSVYEETNAYRAGAVSEGLTDREIIRVVNRYIGASGGYLGDFSYRTHADFYTEYCDLAIDPYSFEGTTRERFIAILSSLEPRDQAKVLRGMLDRFPPDQPGCPDTRPAAHAVVLTLIERLQSGSLIPGATPQIASDVVLRALKDAENLIETSGGRGARLQLLP